MSTVIDVTPEHENELVIGRRLEASPAACFRCWTTPGLMTRWFTPPPWRTTHVEMELRTGGASLVVMEGPEGERVENRGVYLEVVPDRKLVFTDAFTRAWEPSAKAFMVAAVSFEPDGDGCRYVARVRHWSADDAAQHEARGFHAGWSQATDQLEALARTV